MSWTIDKQFDFCYGHQVWVQKLEGEFCESGDASCKCRHAHGHQGHVHVFLEADQLNPQSMVTDFKHLGWLKNFLDDTIDHKFIIDLNDPGFHNVTNGVILPLQQRLPNGLALSYEHQIYDMDLVQVKVPGTDYIAGLVLDTSKVDEEDKDFYDSFFMVNFVPTSENLSYWLYEITTAKMKKLGITVSRIDWFETPKSRSTFIPSGDAWTVDFTD